MCETQEDTVGQIHKACENVVLNVYSFIMLFVSRYFVENIRIDHLLSNQ